MKLFFHFSFVSPQFLISLPPAGSQTCNPGKCCAIEVQNTIPCWPPGFLSSPLWQGGSGQSSDPRVLSCHPQQRVSAAGGDRKQKKYGNIIYCKQDNCKRITSKMKMMTYLTGLDCSDQYSTHRIYTVKVLFFNFVAIISRVVLEHFCLVPLSSYSIHDLNTRKPLSCIATFFLYTAECRYTLNYVCMATLDPSATLYSRYPCAVS